MPVVIDKFKIMTCDPLKHCPCRPCLADVVVKPLSVEHVSKIAQLCYKKKIPMIPFGAGSGFEGGVVPVKVSMKITLESVVTVLRILQRQFNNTLGWCVH